MPNVAEIWRYPVKSMAGQRLKSVEVGLSGLEGDRRYAFVDSLPARAGRFLTARQLDRLLAHHAHMNGNGVQVSTPDGAKMTVTDPRLTANLAAIAGRELSLKEAPGANFDDAPLLLVNMASVRTLAEAAGYPVDHRRFRANLYLEDMKPDQELLWLHRKLRVGGALLEVVKRCERCVMITKDPETLVERPDLLRVLTQVRETRMGLYCRVLEPGPIALGDSCQPV